MRKHLPTIYLIIFLVILLIPSLGMFIFGASESENGEELTMPVFYSEEEGINKEYLQQLGALFESRFALRQQMVTAYSEITGKIFHTSSQSGVIAGEGDWLFFNDTLPDFQRTNILTDRQLHNAVRNLELVNEYCDNNGIEFLFVIAPNKNTLYPEYMPYYLIPGEGPSNRELLDDLLLATQINFTDFGRYDTFLDDDAVYYFHRDSHWNNVGAAIASGSILSSLGVPHHDYTSEAVSWGEPHQGDLEQMIYPSDSPAELETVFSVMPVFTYDAPVESNFDFRIGTSGSGESSLLMYRDSFGSALLPFMAEPFSHAFFSRSNSCQINDFLSNSPDFLIIEKAERFISQLCTSPSRLPAPVRELPENAVPVEVSDLNAAEAGEFVTVTGTLPEGSYSADSLIYIVSGGVCFEACPVSDLASRAESFQALLEKNSVSTDNIMVFIV